MSEGIPPNVIHAGIRWGNRLYMYLTLSTRHFPASGHKHEFHTLRPMRFWPVLTSRMKGMVGSRGG